MLGRCEYSSQPVVASPREEVIAPGVEQRQGPRSSQQPFRAGFPMVYYEDLSDAALKLRLTGPSFKCESTAADAGLASIAFQSPVVFLSEVVEMAEFPATRVMNQANLAEAVMALEEKVRELEARLAELEKKK